MGSVFTTIPDKKIKGFAGKEYSVPMYLQFVPGQVTDVVHSPESSRYNGPSTINTIIAKPHITDKLYKRRATLGEKNRYYPLFRTMNDVPSEGDPVLLCTVGNINYYLGPINTTTNSPTWNEDPSYVPEISIANLSDTLPGNSNTKKGQTENFNKEFYYKRLTKYRKEDLDYGNAIAKTTGDTIFEGRHGNSIRIGSRSNNPYVFISNGRFPDSNVESISDGSLISITSNGSIQRHLAGGLDFDENLVETNVNFQLSSDTVENNSYPIGDIYTSVNGFSDDSFIYSYNYNQILLHSDRITLNSKLDDVYISSKKDIHIGSGRFTTISSGDSVIVNTPDFNIGDPFGLTEMQPMVLGDALVDILTEILNLLPKITIPTMFGPQMPLPDLQVKVTNIINKLNNITSANHKIESN